MLCDAQLATCLPTPVYMNANGEEVEEVSESIGCKVDVKHLDVSSKMVYLV